MHDSFVEWYFTGQITAEDYRVNFPPDDPFIAILRQPFDTVVLYDPHEAVTGLLPRDTQSCFGDSGGWLARFTPTGGWGT